MITTYSYKLVTGVVVSWHRIMGLFGIANECNAVLMMHVLPSRFHL